jgi:putative ABC transport system permease protein
MYDFLQDVRFGVRMLAKSPVLVAVAAVSLAMGIVANTTTFAVANGFLFAPWPFEDQDELLMIWEIHQKDNDDQAVSPGNFLDYRARATVFEDLIAYDVLPANLTGGDEPERVQLVPMSPKTFSLLGRNPVLGRDFEEREGVSGEGKVVILSHPFWKRSFGQDRAVLGKTVTLDGEPYTVVGVTAEDFDFIPADVDIFRPTSWEDRREDRERALIVIGRLKPGRSREEAQAEVETISAQLAKEHPETNEGYHARAIGLRDYFPGPTDTWLMYILLTVSGFVLLIACANIANLLLARAESRQREVAVRTALGAGRSRILRQLLTESVLLALLGGGLGTLLSVYTIRWVSASMPAMLPRSFMPELDGTVLLYTLALSMLAGIVFGVAPALHTFGDDLREALGENSRGGTTTRKRNRLRSAFVVAELAAALALLIGSGALLNIFQKFVMSSPGFEVEGVLTAQLTASENRHPGNSDLRLFYREVLRRLSETPGIESVAAMSQLPRSRAESRTKFVIDGRPTPRYNEEPESGWQSVNAAYFDALGVPVLSGRSVAGSDLEDSAPVAVVNESFVETFFPGEDPIGKGLTVMGKSRRIVGVSKNIYQTRMPERGAKIGPVLYLPMEQEPVRSMSFAMRVQGEPSALATRVRGAVWEVDPDQPVSAVQPLTEHIKTELAGPRILLIVLSVFGGMALLLSAIGVYGVMAHGVAQKTREIGIRMALGAGQGEVLRLVTFQGLRLLVLGFAIGAPFAFALTRAVRAAFSSSVSVASPELVLAVIATLGFVAALATYLPARRASRLQPVRALSTE